MVSSIPVRTLRGFLIIELLIVTLVTHELSLMPSIIMFTERHELNVLEDFFDVACWLVV